MTNPFKRLVGAIPVTYQSSHDHAGPTLDVRHTGGTYVVDDRGDAVLT